MLKVLEERESFVLDIESISLCDPDLFPVKLESARKYFLSVGSKVNVVASSDFFFRGFGPDGSTYVMSLVLGSNNSSLIGWRRRVEKV